MQQFATIISLRGKAILIAAAIAAVSVPFTIGVPLAQTSRPAAPPNILGDYIADLVPPGSPDPVDTPRPATPPPAVRPGQVPKWDAIAIRPCPQAQAGGGVRGAGGGGGAGPYGFSSDRMTLNCLTARSLIRSAYHVYPELSVSGATPMNTVLINGIPGGRGRNPTDGADGGPAWLDTDHYTIEAKAEVVTDRALMQGPMLQAILEERFKIKVHKETREIAVDALVVAKGGSKLKPFVEGSCGRLPPGATLRSLPLTVKLHIKADANGKLSGTMEGQGQSTTFSDFLVEGQTLSFAGPGGAVWKGSIENNGARLNGVFTGGPNSTPLVFTRETAQTVRAQRYCTIGGGGLTAGSGNILYDAEGVTVDEFAKLFLNGYRGRYVIDKTGLTGKFDIHLEAEIGAEVRQRPALADVQFGPSTAPPLPEALDRQLGLKLEATKGPVELLVIDRIERPSPN